MAALSIRTTPLKALALTLGLTLSLTLGLAGCAVQPTAPPPASGPEALALGALVLRSLGLVPGQPQQR